jgi:hypothetical protein
MRKPKRDVLGYINASLEYERGRSIEAPPGGYSRGLNKAEADLVYVTVRDARGGAVHGEAGVVPAERLPGGAPGQCIRSARSRPEAAGHLTPMLTHCQGGHFAGGASLASICEIRRRERASGADLLNLEREPSSG